MEIGGLTDTSASARAEFSGVMVLDATTATMGKPKTLYITGGFYTGIEPVVGVFRYFNGHDHHFEPGSRWFVHTTVASFDKTSVSAAGITVDPEDEPDIMGDIFYISPANDASAKYPPLVRINGRPGNIVEEARSFDIDGTQWISFPNKKAAFFWSGTIPEGWKHKPMPNPKNPKFVSVTGVLTGMRVAGVSKRFYVDISSVTFLGAAPPAYTTKAATPNGKRKAAINFEDKLTPTKKTHT